GDEKMMRHYGDAAPAILTIYGPELESFDARYVDMSSYLNEGSQAKLQLVLRDTNFNLSTGTYDEVSIKSEDRAQVTLRSAAITSLNIVSEGGWVDAAVVRNLSVIHPDACASEDMYDEGLNAAVSLQAVTSGRLNHNGTERD